EPERARQEDAFAARQSVDPDLLRLVAEHEAVGRQLPPNRLDGRDEALVVRGQEADERHQQHARVELVGAERLRERLLRLAPAIRQDLRADLVASGAPALVRAFAT